MQVLTQPPSGWPALVLNADFRPLSYYPLSLWCWQDVVKAVWQDRVDALRQLAGFETTQRLLASRGERQDALLVSVD